ncbi:triose-phosphate isomerase [Marinimicrobium sp. ABcell2]|uniref:triose-phosphate isomerase n=1 Tax=Marinimicrobium sp. ABcell2 TaxID=3069751 RepID=UPI0027B781E2|nr:triose-phosphate isomerase [Marinimicrobium sp. ABcell2]MDQ2075773.1 triose-phosphate isomerase [Marinimicrobium sp. ABcell2]
MSRAENTRRRLVVGNWKMYGSRAFNAELLSAIQARWQGVHQAEVAVCPPFAYLQQAAELLAKSNIVLGAQSLSEYEEGAFTGEVSARMLADWQCRYVIVGHNERRRLQGETDQRVAKKFIAARDADLIPVLCVGESEQDRDSGKALDTIGRQLSTVIDAAGLESFRRAVVAYEPVWAVGTGKTATPEQAQEVHSFIRAQLGALGQSTRVLYGGSVKPDNAEQLFAKADIDGALLGGASLKAEDFIAICQAAD